MEFNRLILMFIWKCKKPYPTKVTGKGGNKIGVFLLPDFKTYYKTRLIITYIVLRQEETPNGTKLNFRKDTYTQSPDLYFLKMPAVRWRKNGVFNNWC